MKRTHNFKIRLPCSCWQLYDVNRYIKVEFDIRYFQWSLSRRLQNIVFLITNLVLLQNDWWIGWLTRTYRSKCINRSFTSSSCFINTFVCVYDSKTICAANVFVWTKRVALSLKLKTDKLWIIFDDDERSFFSAISSIFDGWCAVQGFSQRFSSSLTEVGGLFRPQIDQLDGHQTSILAGWEGP